MVRPSIEVARGLGPAHDAIFRLAGEVGVTTYKTWVKGAHLLVDDDRTRRYTGLIPKISPLAVVTIALAQARLDRMAKHVPLDTPWTAKRAEGMGFALRGLVARAVGNPHQGRP